MSEPCPACDKPRDSHSLNEPNLDPAPLIRKSELNEVNEETESSDKFRSSDKGVSSG